MNKLRQNIFPICCLLLAMVVLLSYALFFENEITKILNGNPSSYSEQLIKWIYPRFSVEKHRFSYSFFTQKAQFVFYRGASVLFAFSVLSFLIINFNKVSTKWNSFWSQTTKNTNTIHRLYIAFMLFFTWDLAWDLTELQSASVFFYQPVFLHKLLHLGFPSTSLAFALLFVFYSTLILSYFNRHRQYTFTIAFLLFIYFEGLLNGFQKIDHGLATFSYAGAGLVLVHFSKSSNSKWALSLTQLIVALCYFLAGLEKITTSGLSWISGETLQGYLIAHHSSAGLWLAQYPFLCQLVMLFTLFFQLGFMAMLFNKNWVVPILIIGIGFHWGTTIFLGINQFINPWIVVYLFFVDWEKFLFSKNKIS